MSKAFSGLTEIIQNATILDHIANDSALISYILSSGSNLKVDIDCLFVRDVAFHPYPEKNRFFFIAQKGEHLSKNNHMFTVFYKSFKDQQETLDVDSLLFTPFSSIQIPEEYGEYLIDYCWITEVLDTAGTDNSKFIAIFTNSHYLVYTFPDMDNIIVTHESDVSHKININLTDSVLVYVLPLAKNHKLSRHATVISATRIVVDPVLKFLSQDDIPWRKLEFLPYNVVSETYYNLVKTTEDCDQLSMQDEVGKFPVKFLALEALGYQPCWCDVFKSGFRRLSVDAIVDPKDSSNFCLVFDGSMKFQITNLKSSNQVLSSLVKLTDIENDPFVKDLWMFLKLTKQLTKSHDYLKKVLVEMVKHEHSIAKFWKNSSLHYETDATGDLFSDLAQHMATGVCSVALKDWFLKQFDSKHRKKYQKILTELYFKPVEIRAFYLAIDVFLDNLNELDTFIKCNQGFTRLLNNNGAYDIISVMKDLQKNVYDTFKSSATDSKMKFSHITVLLKLDQEQHLKFYNWLADLAESISTTEKVKLEPCKISFAEQVEIAEFLYSLSKKIQSYSKKGIKSSPQAVTFDRKTGFNSMNYFLAQARHVVEDIIDKAVIQSVETQITCSLSPIIRELLSKYQPADTW